MILPLVSASHHCLRERARPAQGEPRGLIVDLWDTLHANRALGLAAPQVGVSMRVAVVYAEGVSRALVNPVILWRSKTVMKLPESCLSLPGIEVEVERPIALMLEGEPVPFEGLLARVVQHEIDHLNGVLISDYARAVLTNTEPQP